MLHELTRQKKNQPEGTMGAHVAAKAWQLLVLCWASSVGALHVHPFSGSRETLRLSETAGAVIRPAGSATQVLAGRDPYRALSMNTSLRLRGGSLVKPTSDINWRAVSGNLLGGLTLFLYSMSKLSTCIQAACGEELKNLLTMLSFNRYVCFLFFMRSF